MTQAITHDIHQQPVEHHSRTSPLASTWPRCLIPGQPGAASSPLSPARPRPQFHTKSANDTARHPTQTRISPPSTRSQRMTQAITRDIQRLHVTLLRRPTGAAAHSSLLTPSSQDLSIGCTRNRRFPQIFPKLARLDAAIKHWIDERSRDRRMRTRPINTRSPFSADKRKFSLAGQSKAWFYADHFVGITSVGSQAIH